MTFWFKLPGREKEVGGKRYIEVIHPGIMVRIECTDVGVARPRLKKFLKVLR
jgi:hypothetical protein